LNSSRTLYDTDLADAEWEQLEPLVPAVKSGGRPPKHNRREILNSIFYAVRSGNAWKLLPHDLPPWRTVYHYFWAWRRAGIWQQIHDTLREQVREAAGRNTKPSAAILDSQSVRTSEAGGVRGYDGGQADCRAETPHPGGRTRLAFTRACPQLSQTVAATR
jgi:putative transposase